MPLFAPPLERRIQGWLQTCLCRCPAYRLHGDTLDVHLPTRTPDTVRGAREHAPRNGTLRLLPQGHTCTLSTTGQKAGAAAIDVCPGSPERDNRLIDADEKGAAGIVPRGRR